MDTQVLIKKLNEVFCEINKTGRTYSEVWLSNVDTGGLYDTGKFVLNVTAGHEINSCYSEIEEILGILDQKAKDELEYIWTVRIYDLEEQIHCESNELKVYDEATKC